VLVATVAGLIGVLSFHTSALPVSLAVPSGSANRGSSSTPVATGSPGNTGSGTPPTQSGSGSNPGSGSDPTTTTPATGAGTRTATGASENYNYGTVAVSVTVSGSKITNVQIASLDDGGNFRSESIDQQAIPILEQQALQAQSANIQGVSGATYTSAGFSQSLQSGLSALGFK
jgi:uncharacterized protein with FMN-binding domain